MALYKHSKDMMDGFIKESFHICELRQFPIAHIFVDPKGELCISCDEILSLDDIREIYCEFLPNIDWNKTDKKDIEIKQNIDYDFCERHNKTYIFSPQGINLMKLNKNK